MPDAGPIRFIPPTVGTTLSIIPGIKWDDETTRTALIEANVIKSAHRADDGNYPPIYQLNLKHLNLPQYAAFIAEGIRDYGVNKKVSFEELASNLVGGKALQHDHDTCLADVMRQYLPSSFSPEQREKLERCLPTQEVVNEYSSYLEPSLYLAKDVLRRKKPNPSLLQDLENLKPYTLNENLLAAYKRGEKTIAESPDGQVGAAITHNTNIPPQGHARGGSLRPRDDSN